MLRAFPPSARLAKARHGRICYADRIESKAVCFLSGQPPLHVFQPIEAKSSPNIAHLRVFSKYRNCVTVARSKRLWPYRLTVRTAPFHGVNGGSIPPRVTK